MNTPQDIKAQNGYFKHKCHAEGNIIGVIWKGKYAKRKSVSLMDYSYCKS